MPILNEPEILNNIRNRYTDSNIYTRIGPTLIVINPYKSISLLDAGFATALIEKVIYGYYFTAAEDHNR